MKVRLSSFRATEKGSFTARKTQKHKKVGESGQVQLLLVLNTQPGRLRTSAIAGKRLIAEMLK